MSKIPLNCPQLYAVFVHIYLEIDVQFPYFYPQSGPFSPNILIYLDSFRHPRTNYWNVLDT